MNEPPICENRNCTKSVGKSKKTGKWKKYCSNICQCKEVASRRKKVLDISDAPVCRAKWCNNKCYITSRNKFSEFCSRKCACKHNSISTVDVRKDTCLTKYGATMPLANPRIMEKSKNTNKAKRGVENPMQCHAVKEKHKETLLRNHGVENPLFSTEIKEKSKKTCLDKYGVDHPMKTVEIKQKVAKTTCAHYGTPYASQQHYTDDIQANLANLDYLVRLQEKMSCTDIAKSIGVSKTTILRLFNKNDIPIKTHKTSSLEKEIGKYVEEVLDGGNVILNDKSIITPHELDIVIPEYKIAIECNGSYWHSELQGKSRKYHLNKTDLCKEKGYHLLHIWEHEWNNKQELIKSRINSLLGINERVYARKCDIKSLTTKESSEFLKSNHIQGNCQAGIRYGLFFNDELIAVMTFGTVRFNKQYEYELLRYCSKMGTNVVGGASRLFNHFIKNNNPKSVISYSDRMRNKGNLYENLGFNYIRKSEPSYYYTNDYETFKHRSVFQKHKLKEKLETFDSELTEWENMQQNGYDRIWDCGCDVFGWENESYANHFGDLFE